MFNTLKTFFFGEATIQPQTTQEKKTMFARIDADNNLFSPTGTFIGTYSRRRDAVRGATRRGFKVA